MRIPFIVSGFRHRAALLAVLWPLCATSYGQNDWKQYESEHFRIVGDADLDDTERIVADLEGFQAALEQFFRTTGMRSLPSATLLVLDGKGDLRRTGIEDGDQHFFVGPDRTFAVLTDAGNDEAFEDLLHAWFLVIAERSIPNVPLWMREGLAAFYRTTRWAEDGNQLNIGRPIDEYVRLIQQDRDRLGFERLAEAASLSELPELEDRFRAEAWALAHYLMTREAGRGHDQTAELVRSMASGRAFEDAAGDAFGIGVPALLAEFDANLEGRRIPARLTLALDPGIGRMSAVGEVPRISAMTTIGAVLVAARLPREAELQLGRAVAEDRAAAAPYVALAPLLIDQGRFDEARFAIDTAGRRQDPGYLGHYYYALSLILENPEPTRNQLARIRRELRVAIDQEPAFADAYHQLAASYLATGEGFDDALRLLETALDLSPNNPDYELTYSSFLIEQGRFDDAREVLAALIDRIRDSETRDRGVEILQSIEGRTGGRGLVGDGFAEIRTNTGQPSARTEEPAPAPGPRGEGDGAGIQLVRVVAGEQQPGLLSLVDCRDGLELTIEDETGSYVFRTDSPERVEFSSNIAGNIGREIQCGIQDPPIRVVVTFQPVEPGSESDGVPLKVEFIEE